MYSQLGGNRRFCWPRWHCLRAVVSDCENQISGFQGSQLWQACDKLFVPPFALTCPVPSRRTFPLHQQHRHSQLSTSVVILSQRKQLLRQQQVLSPSFQTSALRTSPPRFEAAEEDSSEQAFGCQFCTYPDTFTSYFPLTKHCTGGPGLLRNCCSEAL